MATTVLITLTAPVMTVDSSALHLLPGLLPGTASWRVERDGVDASQLLEGGDQDGDEQLGPVAALDDGAVGVGLTSSADPARPHRCPQTQRQPPAVPLMLLQDSLATQSVGPRCTRLLGVSGSSMLPRKSVRAGTAPMRQADAPAILLQGLDDAGAQSDQLGCQDADGDCQLEHAGSGRRACLKGAISLRYRGVAWVGEAHADTQDHSAQSPAWRCGRLTAARAAADQEAEATSHHGGGGQSSHNSSNQ